LLGDSYGNRRSVEGTRICYRQSIINKDYLFWLYNFFALRGYCSNLEPRMYTRKLKHKGTEVIHYGYEFNTFTFRSFNWIHEMFYRKGKKVIKPIIENYMTPLCLAIWVSSQPKAPSFFFLLFIIYLLFIIKKKKRGPMENSNSILVYVERKILTN
jgi:hypothetical protein